MPTTEELTANLRSMAPVEGIAPLAVALARYVLESGTLSEEWMDALEQAKGLLGLAPLRIRSSAPADHPHGET